MALLSIPFLGRSFGLAPVFQGFGDVLRVTHDCANQLGIDADRAPGTGVKPPAPYQAFGLSVGLFSRCSNGQMAMRSPQLNSILISCLMVMSFAFPYFDIFWVNLRRYPCVMAQFVDLSSMKPSTDA